MEQKRLDMQELQLQADLSSKATAYEEKQHRILTDEKIARMEMLLTAMQKQQTANEGSHSKT